MPEEKTKVVSVFRSELAMSQEVRRRDDLIREMGELHPSTKDIVVKEVEDTSWKPYLSVGNSC